MGSAGPEKHGFDKSDGKTGNREGSRNLPGNPKDIFGVTDRAIKWMDQQIDAKKPFYLQVSHYATHLAVETKAETAENIKSRTPGKRHKNIRFAGMNQDLDDGIGLLLAEIQRLGIADNTYIIYLADNGSQPTNDPGNINGPLHGWKATIWEGEYAFLSLFPDLVSNLAIQKQTFPVLIFYLPFANGWELIRYLLEWKEQAWLTRLKIRNRQMP